MPRRWSPIYFADRCISKSVGAVSHAAAPAIHAGTACRRSMMTSYLHFRRPLIAYQGNQQGLKKIGGRQHLPSCAISQWQFNLSGSMKVVLAVVPHVQKGNASERHINVKYEELRKPPSYWRGIDYIRPWLSRTLIPFGSGGAPSTVKIRATLHQSSTVKLLKKALLQPFRPLS